MREAGRWQEKVELTLDNRQLYFLFFGTAVAACLVFTVGVLVGKRLEAGARPAAAPSDPLAAIDQLGTAAAATEAELTFHSALVDSRTLPGRLTRSSQRRQSAAHRASPKKETAKSKASLAGKKTPAGTAASRATAKGEAPPKAKTKPQGASGIKAAPAAPRERQVPARAAAAAPPKPERERYVVQLAPMDEQGAAEDVVRRLSASGYRPYLVSTRAGDMGRAFRVRLGEFRSRQAAESAKAAFEQRERTGAYVARLR